MKNLNLKTMTIAAMLGTSLLLTGCGGGGGSMSPMPEQPTPAVPAVPVVPVVPADPTLGTYLEGMDLTYGAADTTLGGTYIGEAVTEVQDTFDAIFDSVASEFVTATTGAEIRTLIESLTEAQINGALAADVRNEDLTQDQADAITDILIPIHRIVNNLTSTEDVYRNLNLSGVEEAHAEGWTGLGVNVSVLDAEFDSFSGHGFNVALLAETVSPGADFDLLDVGDSSLSILDITNSISTADVFTTSVGTNPHNGGDDTDVINALESSSAVVTIAAQHSNWTGDRTIDGNDYEGRGGFDNCSNSGVMTVENCNTWAVSGLDGDNIIFVGEVDSNDIIPEWSNQAGVTHQNNFLVTRSNSLLVLDGVNGNSYAAPRVAGAAALVRHKFPGVSGSETALIILSTADDLGVTGVDAVFGHGRLNVGAALSPVGNLH